MTSQDNTNKKNPTKDSLVQQIRDSIANTMKLVALLGGGRGAPSRLPEVHPGQLWRTSAGHLVLIGGFIEDEDEPENDHYRALVLQMADGAAPYYSVNYYSENPHRADTPHGAQDQTGMGGIEGYHLALLVSSDARQFLTVSNLKP